MCQTIRIPVDIRAPSETPCPGCEHSWRYKRLRCANCLLDSLDRQVVESGLAELIDQILMLDTSLRKGISLTTEDITMEEFLALGVLWQEQDKHRDEEMETTRREAHNAASIPAGYQTRPV